MPALPSLDTFDAVVFDMDGTLIDSEGHYCHAYIHAVTTLGGELDQDGYYQEFCGMTNEQIEALLLDQLPEGTEMPILQELWRSEYDRRRDTEGLPLMPGAADLLATLLERQLPLAVASAAALSDITHSLELARIASHFTALATGEEVAATKPAPDVYLLAARRLGVDPARCLAFEDTNSGATAAIKAGMFTIMVPHRCKPDSFVAQQAKHIAAGLDEVLALLQS